jgi:hypothetical protein
MRPGIGNELNRLVRFQDPGQMVLNGHESILMSGASSELSPKGVLGRITKWPRMPITQVSAGDGEAAGSS